MQPVFHINPPLSPLDDERQWTRGIDYGAPLSDTELAKIQKDIDSICGTTGGRPVVLVAWNGDRKYWKQYHLEFDAEGEAVGEPTRRPQVLFRSERNKFGKIVRDYFVPRWILLDRIEAEQYASTWARESRYYEPTLKKWLQILPSDVPRERYIWRETLAVHAAGCCQRLAKHDIACYGRYAHPRIAIEMLANQRWQMQKKGVPDSEPFAPPDRIERRLREGMTNNYAAQSLRAYRERCDRMIDQAPLAMATPEQVQSAGSFSTLRSMLREEVKQGEERLEKKLFKPNS